MPVVEVKGVPVQVDDEDLTTLLSHNWSWSAGTYLHNYTLGLFHRHILGTPDGIVDHIDRDTTNNRRSNLRVTTKGVNSQNSKRSCRGIHKRGSKYRAYIDYNGYRVYLGSHSDIVAAATHYDMAAIYLYGRFAALNYPERREEYLKQLDNLEEGGEEDAI